MSKKGGLISPNPLKLTKNQVLVVPGRVLRPTGARRGRPRGPMVTFLMPNGGPRVPQGSQNGAKMKTTNYQKWIRFFACFSLSLLRHFGSQIGWIFETFWQIFAEKCNENVQNSTALKPRLHFEGFRRRKGDEKTILGLFRHYIFSKWFSKSKIFLAEDTLNETLWCFFQLVEGCLRPFSIAWITFGQSTFHK